MNTLLQLPHGCYLSRNRNGEPFTIVPTNWQSEKVSTKKPWYIFYRFYDPRVNTKGKQVFIKRMNEFRDRAERQAATVALLKNERDNLLKGYNPIKGLFEPIIVTNPDAITPDTPFITALRMALNRLKVENNTRIDINSKIKYLEQAALHLNFDVLPVKEIRRSHIKQILERIEVICKGSFSDYTYNTYLSKLSILFTELLDWEAAETNPVRDMKKRKWTPQPKRILTRQECEIIDDFVYQFDKRFHRLIHIFHASGARTTEIFRIQGEHVDLKNQVFKVYIKKGRAGRWVEKPIKNVVLPFWVDAMKNCGPKDFVFSKGLEPGPIAINAKQAHKRWARHIQGKRLGKKEKQAKQVKEKLHIDCSWYRLKHLHTERTAAKYGIGLAAAQNSHQSLVVTMNYAVGEKERMLEQQKANDIKFAG